MIESQNEKLSHNWTELLKQTNEQKMISRTLNREEAAIGAKNHHGEDLLSSLVVNYWLLNYPTGFIDISLIKFIWESLQYMWRKATKRALGFYYFPNVFCSGASKGKNKKWIMLSLVLLLEKTNKENIWDR